MTTGESVQHSAHTKLVAVLEQAAGQAHLQLCDWDMGHTEAVEVHGQA